MARWRWFRRKPRDKSRPRRKSSEVRVEPLESEHGFRVIGAVDEFNYQALREALEPELHGTLIIDMAEAELWGDTGLGTLVWAMKRLHEKGGSLLIRNPSPQVRRIFDITGLDRILTIEQELGDS
jgi:anti-anti-sigma factor